jgi:hypothetical protein
MELKRALELKMEYEGQSGIIRVDKQDYICLNELNSFFPTKRLDHWLVNTTAKEFISIVEKNIIPGKSGIIARKGKGGGTWAHHLIAFEFAMWLSPEFKLKVYCDYIDGKQHKQDWNIKRILASNNYKMMTDAITNAHQEPKHYHYSNEALMINEIVFGVRESSSRNNATEYQLDIIASFEQHNATLILLGWSYQQRKEKLTEMFNNGIGFKKELENDDLRTITGQD